VKPKVPFCLHLIDNRLAAAENLPGHEKHSRKIAMCILQQSFEAENAGQKPTNQRPD
jgi:hypothetical protein